MRGSIVDIFLIMAVVFAIGITLVLGDYILTTEQNAFNQTPYGNLTNDTFNKGIASLGIFDGAMSFLFAGLLIATLISAFMIRSHPVFFVVCIIVLAIALTFSGILANTYTQLFTGNALSDSANKMTTTALIMNNLPYIVIGFGVLLMIVTFGKSYSQQGGNI